MIILTCSPGRKRGAGEAWLLSPAAGVCGWMSRVCVSARYERRASRTPDWLPYSSTVFADRVRSSTEVFHLTLIEVSRFPPCRVTLAVAEGLTRSTLGTRIPL